MKIIFYKKKEKQKFQVTVLDQVYNFARIFHIKFAKKNFKVCNYFARKFIKIIDEKL